MNKQELIEKYKRLEGVWSAPGAETARQIFLQDLDQLDEPEKAKVPQFVADYIEFKKENNFHVYGAMRVIEDHHDKRVPEWFYEKNIETFARAWLDGYEVEEEKRYRVKVKGVCGNHETLNCEKLSRIWSFSSEEETTLFKTKHTRKQLEEAGFAEVFNSPLFEVEEVTE